MADDPTTAKPRSRSAGCPMASRRQLLVGAGGLGAAAALGAPAALADAGHAHARSAPNVTDAPTGRATLRDRVPYLGVHQAGITTPRPATGIVAACDVVAQTPQELEEMFRRLTERIAFLTQGGEVPRRDPRLPPADSGLLGPVIEPDGLTITVGLGASLFEDRPWLAAHRPRLLQRMAQFPNDALDADRCHGDLFLQLSANMQDTNIHALRDIMKNLPQFLVMRWMQEGDVPVIEPGPDGFVASARNFLGFHDGSANPDAGDGDLMDRMLWVGADRQEPEWTRHGTYAAVRIIRNFVERWDRTPLREQEHIIGRVKDTGAPLDGSHESDLPDYAADPAGEITPLDAHIRLANPRTPESDENLMLRRPFNYSNGVTRSGQLDQGLLFITFQADLEKGFIAVQERLNGEPLEEYIKPVGGGYYFVLPGVRSPEDYLGQSLIQAVTLAGPSPT